MTKSNKRAIIGVLGAAAVGTAIYLLLAPGKNKKFKKKVADGFGDIADRVGDYFTNKKEKFKSAAHQNLS